MARTPYIALLRGINVTGRNKIAMAELRALCSELGWSEVRSYILSGNLAFSATAAPADLEATLEAAIQDRFGISVPVLVRTAAAWATFIADNPFPQASTSEPNLVLMLLSKESPQDGAVSCLRARATMSERVEQAGEALWIHYAGGVGRSKLTPALLDRLVGSPVTGRNWRTVLKLAAMVGGP